MRVAFSTLACPGWTVERAVDAAVRLGYDGIEWRCADGALLGPDTPDDVWERIAVATDEASVANVCLDTSAVFLRDGDAASAACRAMVVRAAAIRAPCVRVFAGAVADGRSRAEAALAVGPLLADAVDHAALHDVAVLVEAHDDWARAQDLRRLVDAAPGLGVLWDVVHSHRAGESPRETVEVLAEAIRHVHVKDDVDGSLVLPGRGRVPLRDAVVELGVAGYDAWLSFEHEKLWHPELEEPEDALAHAARHLRALLD